MSDIKKISPVLKSFFQQIIPINVPAPINLRDSYLAESNKIYINKSSVERRPINDAIQKINTAVLGNVQDVEVLKKQLGIENYSVKERINFYFLSIKEKTSNQARIANLDGLIAYEMNGMSIVDIYDSLHFLVSAGFEHLNKLKNNAEIFPVLGKNSRIFNILKTIIEYQQINIVSRVLHPEIPATVSRNSASVNLMEQSENEKLIVMWNRAKFIANQHFILSPANQDRLFRSNQHSYSGNPKKDPFPQTTANIELARFIWDELSSEGSCASINIWDSAIFTWGRGFAGKGGGLGGLLYRLYNIFHFRHLFQSVGINVSIRNSLSILTEDGWRTVPNNESENWQYIKNNKSLILFFIALGEIEHMPLPLSATHEYYQQINSDSQLAEIVNTNGIFHVPTPQLEKWKSDFGYDSVTQRWPTADQTNNYRKFILLNSHIFHWMPVFGMDGAQNILKDKNGIYYKASVRNTLIQFADRAAADPIKFAWTDAGLINNDEQEKIFYNSLLQTNPIGLQTFIMDRGHFMSFGGDMGKNIRVNLPVEHDINRGLADGSVIEFQRIGLIDSGQPRLGYQIYTRQQDGSMSVLKLNQKKFQGAAIYYVFEKNAVKKGYVITRR